jgi:hypothetical protein
MSTVTEIIEAVKGLGVEEKGEFLTRLSEVDFDGAWDLQISADAQAGRLDLDLDWLARRVSAAN